jgi:peptidyl-prolyl cis-trans isomerase D
MFDAVRNNKRIVQLFLALITLPFAFWGVDSYVRHLGENVDVASVGDSKITQQEFQKVWREQVERMRGMLGANFNPQMFDTPEARLAVVNDLVEQRLLLLEAARSHMGTSDEALRDVISKIPAVQENGQFSMARYEAALKAQGLTQAGFEQQLRQNLTLQQIAGALGNSALVSKAAVDAAYRAQVEERQVAELRFTPEQYLNQVKVDDAAIKSFYDTNKSAFEIPEQVRAEYLTLSLTALQAQVTVSNEEVKAWFEGHKDRYQQAEERRASHILIPADANASAADKNKAKAKAEEVLKEVQKAPGKFADLAKQYSQDPGSAAKGGDLGFFGRGMMVKAFDDAVAKLKEGEISGLVQSEFGYHIIKLTGIKAGKGKSFDEVRPEIEAELKRQAAAKKYAEAAESFSNMVYEQADSLKPAADKYKLVAQQSGWIPKTITPQAAAAAGPLANPKLLAALFSEDALKSKRNTEAVEVAPNTLVAARVVEYKPASMVPFDSVKADIEKRLKREEALKLAKKAGEAKLAELQSAGRDTQSWGELKTVSRIDPKGVTPPAVVSIFKADAKKLPAYAGADNAANGYAVYKLVKVSQPEKVDEAKLKATQQQMGNFVAQQDVASYLTALRARYKVQINKDVLGSNKEK